MINLSESGMPVLLNNLGHDTEPQIFNMFNNDNYSQGGCGN